MCGSDYIFFGDADGKTICDRKEILANKYSRLDKRRIFIVQYEIESWYYAGIDITSCRKLKLRQYVHDTNTLTKEQFYAKLPKKAERKYIMIQLLEKYNLELAISRNESLSLFNREIKKEPA